MSVINNSVSKKNIVFFFGYALMMIAEFIEFSHFSLKWNLNLLVFFMEVGSYILFFLSFLIKNKVGKINVRNIVLIGVFILISMMLCKKSVFIKLYLCIIAVPEIDIKKVVKYDFFLRMGFISILFVMCIAKIFPLYHITMLRVSNYRMILGFNHPNYLGLYVFNLFCEYIYLNFERIKLKQIGFISLLAVIFYFCNISRTIVLCMIGTLGMLIISQVNKKIFFSKIVKYIPIFICFLGLIFIAKYDANNTFMCTINNWTSGRIYLGNLYYKIFGMSLFGQYIPNISSLATINVSSTAFDSAYMHMFVEFGVAVLIIFVYLYTKLIEKCINNKDVGLLILCIIFVFYGLSETYSCDIATNFTLLYFSSVIYSKQSSKATQSKIMRRIRANAVTIN